MFYLYILSTFAILLSLEALHKTIDCRCIPGDSCWPAQSKWRALNETLQGRLIATVPIAQVCHAPHYDQEACSTLQATWSDPQTHIFSPGDFVAPYFQNQTCDPYTPTDKPCTLGNYPPYSINVTTAADVIAGLRFAQKHNVRLVIKNTGQDFLGKSSGKGALELWMANVKSSYSGPAFKLGAGLHNVRLVGGSSPTVGVAGGFTSGGGHSPLSGHYGLAADSVLEWEVVTPNGEHVVAAPHGKHADFYWAMTGGGGGTWGVVLSMTAKVYPDGKVGGASLTVSSKGLAPDTYWGTVTAFHRFIPTFANYGTVATSLLNGDGLTMFAATSPDATADEVRSQLSSFVGYLDIHNITYSVNYTEFGNYYDHLMYYLGPYPFGSFPVTQLTGGQLVSRAVLQSQKETTDLVRAVRSAIANGDFYVTMESFDLNATTTARAAYREGQNSAKAAWRESALYYIVISPWDWTIPREEMVARQERLTNTILPALAAAAPGTGAYLNEGNFADPNWQQSFYAENYPRLAAIKEKVDPRGLLYARTAVGSEAWREDTSGRLCFVG
ncbi:FAD-binding domain-containing protein [Astrocystis sublimbata]|nr:FAD-binding domain-containing protein [Astrocystis sublimbata]